MSEPDWRLANSHEHLRGATFIRRRWRETRPGWDHDHCEFCWAKFGNAGDEGFRDGYTTPDEYHWVCEKCFNDFRVAFRWEERT